MAEIQNDVVPGDDGERKEKSELRAQYDRERFIRGLADALEANPLDLVGLPRVMMKSLRDINLLTGPKLVELVRKNVRLMRRVTAADLNAHRPKEQREAIDALDRKLRQAFAKVEADPEMYLERMISAGGFAEQVRKERRLVEELKEHLRVDRELRVKELQVHAFPAATLEAGKLNVFDLRNAELIVFDAIAANNVGTGDLSELSMITVKENEYTKAMHDGNARLATKHKEKIRKMKAPFMYRLRIGSDHRVERKFALPSLAENGHTQMWGPRIDSVESGSETRLIRTMPKEVMHEDVTESDFARFFQLLREAGLEHSTAHLLADGGVHGGHTTPAPGVSSIYLANRLNFEQMASVTPTDTQFGVGDVLISITRHPSQGEEGEDAYTFRIEGEVLAVGSLAENASETTRTKKKASKKAKAKISKRKAAKNKTAKKTRRKKAKPKSSALDVNESNTAED